MAESKTYRLDATIRTEHRKSVKAIRAAGGLPGVIYGHGIASRSLTLNAKAFTSVFRQSGRSALVDVAVDGAAPVKVLVHALEVNPLRNEATHVDFYQVNLNEKLRTSIPLEFTGTAEAAEVLGGTMITVKEEVEVECYPADLVPSISVDLSKLKTFEDTLTVADIVAPKGIAILDEADQTLVSVTEQRSDEEMAALDEAPDAAVATEFSTVDGVEPAKEDVK